MKAVALFLSFYKLKACQALHGKSAFCWGGEDVSELLVSEIHMDIMGDCFPIFLWKIKLFILGSEGEMPKIPARLLCLYVHLFLLSVFLTCTQAPSTFLWRYLCPQSKWGEGVS